MSGRPRKWRIENGGWRMAAILYPLFSILVLLSLPACDTTYKVGPSTTPMVRRAGIVERHVSVAKTSNDSARERAAEIESNTRSTVVTTQTLGENIDAAMREMEAHNYAAAANYLSAAKVGYPIIMKFLEQTLRDLQSMNRNFASVKQELDEAQGEMAQMQEDLTALQGKLDAQTVESANDHEIAKRCKSWFGLGALFYGIEHMLKAGILGILILVGLALVVIVFGYFAGGPVGAIVFNLAGRLKKS
jgi:hypothetical protein